MPLVAALHLGLLGLVSVEKLLSFTLYHFSLCDGSLLMKNDESRKKSFFGSEELASKAFTANTAHCSKISYLTSCAENI